MSSIDGAGGAGWWPEEMGGDAGPSSDAASADPGPQPVRGGAVVSRGWTPAAAPVTGNKIDDSVLQWKPLIEASAQRYGVPAALIAAVIERESSGNPNALSLDHGHGKGLMQIDDRSSAFARGPKALDPAANIDQGTSILAANMRAFPDNLPAAIAAYNAGAGGVRRTIADGGDPADATYSPSYVSDIQTLMSRYESEF